MGFEVHEDEFDMKTHESEIKQTRSCMDISIEDLRMSSDEEADKTVIL